MVSLHGYFTPKPGKNQELLAAIRDKWYAAMSEQPGFIAGALLRPLPDEVYEERGVPKPEHTFEVVSFWRSEEERAAWTARPIHQEVFPQVLQNVETRRSVVQQVEHTWNI